MTLLNKIQSVEDLAVLSNKDKKVITLFSGGLDSTYLLYLLQKNGFKNILALTIDLGDDIDHIELNKIAAKFGAQSLVLDCKELFVREAVVSAIKAQARYLGIYPISASLSRPLIAQEAIRLARLYDSNIILHTANQSQNSLRRLNGAIEQLGFKGYYGTPYEFSTFSRKEKASELIPFGLNYLENRNYSGDSNLWCREFESGSLDDPEHFEISESLYKWSKPQTSHKPLLVSVHFESGVPVKVNDESMKLIELIAYLNYAVGSFGLGRYSGLEHLDQGEKVLEVREMPAAYLLLDAYRHLETATLSAGLLKEKLIIEQSWVNEAVEGRWFGHLKLAMDSFIESTAKCVNGTVSYIVNQHGIQVYSIKASAPLYLRDRDAWEKQIAQKRGRRLMDKVAVAC